MLRSVRWQNVSLDVTYAGIGIHDYWESAL
jgi:hypothetical protein